MIPAVELESHPPVYSRAAVCRAAGISEDQYQRYTAELVGEIPQGKALALTRRDITEYAFVRELTSVGFTIGRAAQFVLGDPYVHRYTVGHCTIDVDAYAVCVEVDSRLAVEPPVDLAEPQWTTRAQLARERQVA